MSATRSGPPPVAELVSAAAAAGRHRMAAGQMVVVRSHFKSIYLVPMAIVSLVLGIFGTVTEVGADAQSTYGLIWVCCFCLYMNVFIFEFAAR